MASRKRARIAKRYKERRPFRLDQINDKELKGGFFWSVMMYGSRAVDTIFLPEACKRHRKSGEKGIVAPASVSVVAQRALWTQKKDQGTTGALVLLLLRAIKRSVRVANRNRAGRA